MPTTTYDDTIAWGRHTVESVRTPDYWNIVASGQDLPYNPYTLVEEEGRSPLALTYNGWVTQRDASPFQTFRVCVNRGYIDDYVGTPHSVAKIADLENEVEIRLLEQVRDTQIDLGVALGEYRETAAFFKGTCVKLVKAYRHARKGRASKALAALTGRPNPDIKDLIGVVSDLWLSLSYAVRPLARDMADAVNVLEGSLYQGGVNRMHYVRSRKTQLVEERMFRAPSSKNSFTVHLSGLVKVSGKLAYRIDNPELFQMSQLGLTNMPATLWELTPWSFVVDWFVPIGTWLHGLQPPSGVAFHGGYIYTKYHGISQNSSWQAVNPWLGPYGWDTTAWTKEQVKVRRVLTGWPVPRLIVPDLDLSKSQIASGLALLWSTVERSQRPKRLRSGRGGYTVS